MKNNGESSSHEVKTTVAAGPASQGIGESFTYRSLKRKNYLINVTFPMISM